MNTQLIDVRSHEGNQKGRGFGLSFHNHLGFGLMKCEMYVKIFQLYTPISPTADVRLFVIVLIEDAVNRLLTTSIWILSLKLNDSRNETLVE